MEIEYRQPMPDDAEAIAEIINQSNKGLKHHTVATPGQIRSWVFSDKDYDPKAQMLGLADGKPVAYADTFLPKELLKAGLSPRLSIFVVPEWRGRGIEEYLLDYIISYLRSKDILKLNFSSYVESDWGTAIARNAGMKVVRHGFQMICPSKKHKAVPELKKGFSLRSVMMADATDNDLEMMVEALNDAFSESWNFFPQTVDSMSKIRDEQLRTGDSESRITFAMKGGELAGAIISTISPVQNKGEATKAGTLHGLGVRKPYRGLGLGRALLADSMAWLSGRGIAEFHLGVDAGNEGALGLYKSLGFMVDRESITYELDF